MTDAEVVMDALRSGRWTSEMLLDLTQSGGLAEIYVEDYRLELAYLNAAIARRCEWVWR